jgi:predicted dehydrogenase
MQKIRVGIIGCGVIAPTHAECYRKIAGVELAWACDLIEDKARALADKYQIEKVTVDYRDVMADPSVTCVSVCTDHASHAPISVAALKAGKHVLCEKALTSSTKGLNAMMAAHRQRPKLVFEGVFQHRFDALYRHVKSLIEKRTFGTILTAAVQVRCKRTNEYYRTAKWRGTWAEEGGAVLINQAIHYIDVLVWIMGGVDSVCGVYDNLTHKGVIETEDTATAALRFRCGAVGTIEATCSSHLDWEPTISIHGAEGSIDLRGDQPIKVVFQDKAKEETVRAELVSAVNTPGELLGKSYYGTGHPAQIEDFVSAIREKRKPHIPAASARHTVDVVLAIFQSHRKGRWVKIPAPGR